jgi:hypothetical protein
MCEQTPPDRPITVKSDRPSVSLHNLHPHSRYRISVAARTTTAGEAVSQEVTTDQAVPTSAPRSLRVQTPADATGLALNWQAPPCLDTNGEIREYEYELSGEDRWANGQKKQGVISATLVTIDGLTPYTKYRARVRAYSRFNLNFSILKMTK